MVVWKLVHNSSIRQFKSILHSVGYTNDYQEMALTTNHQQYPPTALYFDLHKNTLTLLLSSSISYELLWIFIM